MARTPMTVIVPPTYLLSSLSCGITALGLSARYCYFLDGNLKTLGKVLRSEMGLDENTANFIELYNSAVLTYAEGKKK